MHTTRKSGQHPPPPKPCMWLHEEDKEVIVENLAFKNCKTYQNKEDMKVSQIF